MQKFHRLCIGLTLALSCTLAFAATNTNSADSFVSRSYIPWTFPGTTLSSPSGFGAQWGQAYMGGGYQNRARQSQTPDGALAVGLGIGDPVKYIGLDASLGIYDVSKFKNGGVSLKVHRQLPGLVSIAVGRDAAFGWGEYTSAQGWYGSVSKVFIIKSDPTQWFSALTLTAGVGNGRFLSEKNILNNLSANGVGINGFGSAAIRVKEPVAFIADWTGQDLNVGLSITPIRSLGLFINPSLADVTHTAGDGTRFILAVGLGYSFI